MLKADLSWVVVSDLQKAIEFYTEVVGLILQEKHTILGWASLRGKDGGACLGLAETDEENVRPGSNAVVVFTVDDIDAAKKDLQSKGVTLICETQEVIGVSFVQMFSDKDGNVMQLHSPIKNTTQV